MPEVLALVADLLFASRIRGAGAAVGVSVRTVGSGPELTRLAQAAPPRLILIDLDGRTGDAPAHIAELRSRPALAGTRIFAFGSHVQGELLRAARAAGADRVLARSAFVRELPDILRGSGGAPPPGLDPITGPRRHGEEDERR